MIDGKTVGEHEHGLVRVFKATPKLAEEIERSGEVAPIQSALGVERIDIQDVQVLKTSTLEGMSVTSFLQAGYDVRDEDVADNRSALNALDAFEGLLLVVRSGAFLDRPATLRMGHEVELIATLREPEANVTFAPLPNPEPEVEGQPRKKPSDAAISGRVATFVLLIMAALVLLMIWVAG